MKTRSTPVKEGATKSNVKVVTKKDIEKGRVAPAPPPLKRKDKGKINTIISEIEGLMLEEPPKDKAVFLGYISNILCQLDTDIAIEVMENFGEEGKHEAMAIKVNYGY